MGEHKKNTPVSRHTAFNNLKEQLYSLNMRLLLAMQCHAKETETKIIQEIAEIRQKIDHMSLGDSRFRK